MNDDFKIFNSSIWTLLENSVSIFVKAMATSDAAGQGMSFLSANIIDKRNPDFMI